jgi:hypothetical protein
VITDQGPEEREILVGLSNEKMAEIKSGLAAGEQVVINPRALLSEKDKMRLAEPERPDFGKTASDHRDKAGSRTAAEHPVNRI